MELLLQLERAWKSGVHLLSGFGSRKMEEIGFGPFLALMLISLLAALFISFLYLKFYRARATGSMVYRAFPLLGISITAIFICIQFSLPLSLGLLGALSIVRFRTPIKEPEEIGFIMLVVATSICCATFNMLFLAVILIVAVVALYTVQFVKKILKGKANDGVIVIKLSSDLFNSKGADILNILREKIKNGKIESINEHASDMVLSYSFIKKDEQQILQLQQELKKFDNALNINVFMNRIGEI